MARLFCNVTSSSRRPLFQNVVNIIGFPMAWGQRKAGVEQGPNAIRSSGLREKLMLRGCPSVRDAGDLQLQCLTPDQSGSSALNAGQVSAACRLLADSVRQSVSSHYQTLVLGGDHSLAMGSIYGHATAAAAAYSATNQAEGSDPADIAVIWIDAHADMNTEKTSTSHKMHGMPASFLVRGLAASHSFPWISPVVHAKHFAFIGLRDVEAGEQRLINSLAPNLTIFNASDVRSLGARDVILKVLEKINPHNELPIHVSFDIDAIDPKIAPSTGTPVPGGLVPDDAFIIGEHVSQTRRLRVMDMVEVNPLIGSETAAKRTASVASEIIASFFQQSDH